MRALLLGDEVGIPALISLCQKIGIEISGIGFSKKLRTLEKWNVFYSRIKILELPENEPLNNFISNEKVDCVLVFSYDRILHEVTLNLPGIKFVNIHAGKIPEYRGANVLNWAIINGEREIGVTIHEIARKVDTGPIISEWTVPIGFTDTALSVRDSVVHSVIQKVPIVLGDFLEGKIMSKPQMDTDIPPWPRRKPEDGTFDWSMSNEAIYNLIRGLVNPWPGARFVNRKGQVQIINNFLYLEEIQALRESESLSITGEIKQCRD